MAPEAVLLPGAESLLSIAMLGHQAIQRELSCVKSCDFTPLHAGIKSLSEKDISSICGFRVADDGW
jgi:hypothetical protein